MSIRVIISDDHPIIRLGVRILLEEGGIEVVGEAGGGDSLLALLRHTPCDVLVTDLTMPDETLDGPPLLARIRTQHPELPVLVLTATAGPGLLARLLRNGVRGVVDKTAEFDEVARGTLAVAAGERFVSRQLLRRMKDRDMDGPRALCALSPHERDVVQGLRQGLDINALAARRGCSPKTISRQKADAMRKLGVAGDHELHALLRADPDAGLGID